ncbi:MAG: hypothetical protein KBT36_05665 [Kurthia sp.]|nr:hypothetical protein [Candidatus Kurthia equi]
MEAKVMKCFCGSEKAMKDCCFSQKKITLEKHWTAIKGRVLQKFIAEHPTADEKLAIEQWAQQDNLHVFSNQMDQITLNHLLADVYFFTKNREQWSYHLMKCMKEIVQPRTHAILTSWQKPYYFIGEIIDSYEDYLILQHIWTGEMIYLADSEMDDEIVGNIILGHIIPGVNEYFYNLLSSAIVIDGSQRDVLNGWRQNFEQSKYENLEMFYENELINCLLNLMTDIGFYDEEEVKIPNIDFLQLIMSLDMQLLKLELSTDRLPIVFFMYMAKKGSTLKIRKQQALVAAILDFGMKNDLIPKIMTQRKLSEIFGVSTATIANYSRKITLYYDEEFNRDIFEKVRQPKEIIGTDATEEEYRNWQVARHLEKMAFTNTFEQKRMEKKMRSIPFRPVKNVDKAQKYAYEAYLSDNKEKRLELAQLAYMNDKNNLDANLLMHEDGELEQRLAILEKVNFQQYDRQMIVRLVYAQVVLLYSLQRFDEALHILNQLSKEEIEQHNMLKYLHPLLRMLKDDLGGVSQIMLDEKEQSPFKNWMLWTLAIYTGQQSDDSILLNAIHSNPFVKKYIEIGLEPYAFPSKLSCSYGNPSEAKIIYFAIYPFLKYDK